MERIVLKKQVKNSKNTKKIYGSSSLAWVLLGFVLIPIGYLILYKIVLTSATINILKWIWRIGTAVLMPTLICLFYKKDSVFRKRLEKQKSDSFFSKHPVLAIVLTVPFFMGMLTELYLVGVLAMVHSVIATPQAIMVTVDKVDNYIDSNYTERRSNCHGQVHLQGFDGWLNKLCMEDRDLWKQTKPNDTLSLDATTSPLGFHMLQLKALYKTSDPNNLNACIDDGDCTQAQRDILMDKPVL